MGRDARVRPLPAVGDRSGGKSGIRCGGGRWFPDGGGARGTMGPCLVNDQTVAAPTWWNRVRTARGHDSSGAACRDRRSGCGSSNRASSRTSWPMWPRGRKASANRSRPGPEAAWTSGCGTVRPWVCPHGVPPALVCSSCRRTRRHRRRTRTTRPSLRGLLLRTGCSGPANRQPPGHLPLAERLDALIDFDGLPSSPRPP